MKYFVAVADSGSISEAAKRLFAAQSSVSEAVRAVEGHYGIKAFLRTPKGVMLTGDGKELFIEFKGILNRLYYLDVRYEDKKDSSHGFYVAAQHHICGMDSFLSIIQSLDVPEYNAGFRECRTSEVFEQVEKGLADLGVIFFAEQLWETTMDPERRVLLRVTLDEETTSEIDLTFTSLMGDQVDPRREFIEANAKYVQNLDV